MGRAFSDRKCKMNIKKMCGFTSLVKSDRLLDIGLNSLIHW